MKPIKTLFTALLILAATGLHAFAQPEFKEITFTVLSFDAAGLKMSKWYNDNDELDIQAQIQVHGTYCTRDAQTAPTFKVSNVVGKESPGRRVQNPSGQTFHLPYSSLAHCDPFDNLGVTSVSYSVSNRNASSNVGLIHHKNISLRRLFEHFDRFGDAFVWTLTEPASGARIRLLVKLVR